MSIQSWLRWRSPPLQASPNWLEPPDVPSGLAAAWNINRWWAVSQLRFSEDLVSCVSCGSYVFGVMILAICESVEARGSPRSRVWKLEDFWPAKRAKQFYRARDTRPQLLEIRLVFDAVSFIDLIDAVAYGPSRRNMKVFNGVFEVPK